LTYTQKGNLLRYESIFQKEKVLSSIFVIPMQTSQRYVVQEEFDRKNEIAQFE